MFIDSDLVKKLSDQELVMYSLAMIIAHMLLPYHTVMVPELIGRVKASNRAKIPWKEYEDEE